MNVCMKLDLAKGKKNDLVVIKLDISKAYDTNKHVDQLAWGCSILTKILGSRLGNAAVLNTCWESFAALVVLPGSNLD